MSEDRFNQAQSTAVAIYDADVRDFTNYFVGALLHFQQAHPTWTIAKAVAAAADSALQICKDDHACRTDAVKGE